MKRQTKSGIRTESSSSLRSAALREIQDREERRIDWGRVDALCTSIRAIGLLEPIAVDGDGNVLSGAHRLAALRRIARMDEVLFARHFPDGRVPVRVFTRRSADAEHRKNYSDEDILALDAQLRAAGFRDVVGRPKVGQRALRPALALAVGKSPRTLSRILARARGERHRG